MSTWWLTIFHNMVSCCFFLFVCFLFVLTGGCPIAKFNSQALMIHYPSRVVELVRDISCSPPLYSLDSVDEILRVEVPNGAAVLYTVSDHAGSCSLCLVPIRHFQAGLNKTSMQFRSATIQNIHARCLYFIR